ncbi:MAG: hypothetical protein LAN37_03925 [Acidobacteriia bacterium]|nr:hypothetical protein [Terriglobia bacterium]
MATLATSEAVAPVLPAGCSEMLRLREQARQFQEKLRTSRQKAREHEKQDRRTDRRGSHSNDFELFLQRKLLKTSLMIARHIAEHRCEELGIAS